jgi:hypothetical protein
MPELSRVMPQLSRGDPDVTLQYQVTIPVIISQPIYWAPGILSSSFASSLISSVNSTPALSLYPRLAFPASSLPVSSRINSFNMAARPMTSPNIWLYFGRCGSIVAAMY